MTDEPASPSSLAGLDVDLARSFVPAWAKEDAPRRAADSLALDERETAEPRRRPDRERGAGGRRDDRSRRPGPPRVERSDRAGRPPREGRGRPGGPRGARDDRAPARPEGPAPLAGWKTDFQAEPTGVENVARQIRTGAKTYPLFDLAWIVLEKPDRYRIVFRREGAEAPALFQFKLDGTLWLSARDAVLHAITRHRDRYYRTEKASVEPPKGVHTCVAVCGMTGTLIGPPNLHDYTLRLIRLHAERCAQVPFEVFKNRIRMERDEAVVARWKEEQSTRDEYVPLDAATATPPAEAPVAPASDAEPAAAAEAPAAETAVEGVEAVAPAAGTGSDAAPAETVQTPEPDASAEEPSAAPAEGEGASPRLKSLAELEAHFREHHAPRLVMEIREKITISGTAAAGCAAPVATLVRRNLDELRRFPLPLAHRLGQQLGAKGLHVFKARQNITCIGPARPRYLDRTASPVADSVAAILDYLEAHPRAKREDQWAALAALFAALPEAEREAALARDLLWLLHEGHVIDYARGNLEAARKPQPRPQPAAPAAPAASGAGEEPAVPAPSTDAGESEPSAAPATPDAGEAQSPG